MTDADADADADAAPPALPARDADAPPSRTVKLTIAYDGTAYCGWETQKNGQAIQPLIEAAIFRITGERVEIAGSGRTDAGVHAIGQVATFPLTRVMLPEKLRLALNAVLPADIAIVEAEDAPPGFHARFSAVWKHYRYTILNERARRPLVRHSVFHFPQALDVAAMDAAARTLTGTHDFRAFAREAWRKKNCVRTVFSATVRARDGLLLIDLTGSGFLYNMVRIVAGTLIDVGIGRKSSDIFLRLFEAPERALAGFTVPPHGLCLMGVGYMPWESPAPSAADAAG